MFKEEKEIAGIQVIFKNYLESSLPPPLRDAILDLFIVTHPRARSGANWMSPGVSTRGAVAPG